MGALINAPSPSAKWLLPQPLLPIRRVRSFNASSIDLANRDGWGLFSSSHPFEIHRPLAARPAMEPPSLVKSAVARSTFLQRCRFPGQVASMLARGHRRRLVGAGHLRSDCAFIEPAPPALVLTIAIRLGPATPRSMPPVSQARP